MNSAVLRQSCWNSRYGTPIEHVAQCLQGSFTNSKCTITREIPQNYHKCVFDSPKMGHLITPIDKAVEKQPPAQGTQRQPLQDWPLPLHGPEHKDPGGDTSDFFERNTVDPKWKKYHGLHKRSGKKTRWNQQNHAEMYLQLHLCIIRCCLMVFIGFAYGFLCEWVDAMIHATAGVPGNSAKQRRKENEREGKLLLMEEILHQLIW